MFYLEVLAEKTPNGYIDLRRRPDYAHLIDVHDDSQVRDAFGHRLMLSYELYTVHGEKAWWMLNQPVYAFPRFMHRIIRSPERFRSMGIMDLMHMLYIDPDTHSVSPLIHDESRHSPIGLLRLNVLLDQLSVNYDVYGMDAQQLLSILPNDFKRLLANTGSAIRR